MDGTGREHRFPGDVDDRNEIQVFEVNLNAVWGPEAGPAVFSCIRYSWAGCAGASMGRGEHGPTHVRPGSSCAARRSRHGARRRSRRPTCQWRCEPVADAGGRRHADVCRRETWISAGRFGSSTGRIATPPGPARRGSRQSSRICRLSCLEWEPRSRTCSSARPTRIEVDDRAVFAVGGPYQSALAAGGVKPRKACGLTPLFRRQGGPNGWPAEPRTYRC